MGANNSILAKRMDAAISANHAKVRAGQYEEGTGFTIRRIDAGKLVLPTGRICVIDAYGADCFPAMTRIVAPGSYSVDLVIAELPKDLPFGNDRCAFAVVTFSNSQVSSWEPVTAVASSGPCFTDSKPNKFVQEGGTGLFSPEAGAVHFAHLSQQFDQQLKMIRKQAKRYGAGEWVNYTPGQDQANVIICEGGMGDGTYECFVGLTDIGRMARLVVDFGICDPATA
ncbi:MAG TPA: DUF4241 domain-containing protein [Tepidisphaeraceae bacterium]|nr:DUF4241 domain-containing protein [Tepidisphaeraceae bacterium]